MKQTQILLRDKPVVDEELPVDQTLPEVPSDQDDDYILGLAGLEERQRFEQFVQGAESSGKGHERLGPDQKVHLPDGEITELKTQLRRDVGIGMLFVG